METKNYCCETFESNVMYATIWNYKGNWLFYQTVIYCCPFCGKKLNDGNNFTCINN